MSHYPERYYELLQDNRLWFGSSGDNPPRLKVFASEVQEGIVPDTWWRHEDVGNNQEAKKEILELFTNEEPYSTPKPTRLINRMLQISTNPDSSDVVLDFFAGSGTTAHSVLQLNRDDDGNRKFIMVQLPEPTGSPDYPTIADIGKERIRRVIKKLNDDENGKLKAEDAPPQDRGFKAFKLTSSNFETWGIEAPVDSAGDITESCGSRFREERGVLSL
jgi:adenine-specific DNA-methyltransferase